MIVNPTTTVDRQLLKSCQCQYSEPGIDNYEPVILSAYFEQLCIHTHCSQGIYLLWSQIFLPSGSAKGLKTQSHYYTPFVMQVDTGMHEQPHSTGGSPWGSTADQPGSRKSQVTQIIYFAWNYEHTRVFPIID